MVPLLVAPMLVVPTELTEHTEAYGLIFLESTERIDATRHTTESTEMIACVASPKAANHAIISVDSCLAKRRILLDSKTLSWGRGVPSPSIWVADEPLSAKA